MSFAIIETGGKQHKIAEGDTLSVERLAGHTEGDTIVFDKVLLIDDGKSTKIGTPYIEGSTVEVTFNAEIKGKKLLIQKFKAKSRYKRRLGHRQKYSKVSVNTIK